MKHLNKYLTLPLAALAVCACTDEYTCDLQVEQPEDAAIAAELAQYGVLNEYAAFPLGVQMTAAAAATADATHAALITNFDAVDLDGSFLASSMYSEGAYNFMAIADAATAAAKDEITYYGGRLVSAKDQRGADFAKLIADVTTPVVTNDGTTSVDLATQTPTFYNPKKCAKELPVAIEQDETMGTVLALGDGKVTATNANGAAKIHIVLPQGITLGDCKALKFKLWCKKNVSETANLLLYINKGTAKNLGYSAQKAGASGAWAPLEIDLTNTNVPKCELTAAEKALTEFDLALGAAQKKLCLKFAAISFDYSAYVSGGETIVKTDAEKKDIITAQLRELIGGMAYNGANPDGVGSIASWDIITEPLAAETDAKDFSWKQYLGDDDYARIAVAIVKDTLAGVPAEKQPTLFVEQTIAQADPMADYATLLAGRIQQWEADGVTKFDGINIRLHAVLPADADAQAAAKADYAAMLQTLAATGKAVRLSDVTLKAETATATHADKVAVADAMRDIVAQYRTIVPQAQQAGIVFRSINSTAADNTLTPWSKYLDRTEMYQGIARGLGAE